ncbi:hypothetical protein BHECKSOX_1055 [Bathymodiolus heckerae thiotrophic gill symbiont]|uniref:hypothetical protein n=1 Tax=Bathymodiolus heckerae thiotrophic gill symbiont TaxID=1052212 RepID=UPI0010BB463F|nr:hypothetical protein [Bathymodiolus heckerae thiotrophic gill symbiont]SHN93784.1 hypothetical protein BHECKSOX_1055 [Bathymodiolus heckerae thiotrophic gill symbiont]
MNFKKITAYSLLLAGIAMSPHALAEQSFHGHTVNVAFEYWHNDVHDDHGDFFLLKNQKDVMASDSSYPDETDFYVVNPDIDYFYWDIDFSQNMIELAYTSIQAVDDYNQTGGSTHKGFHFNDVKNSLPDIINVIVDDTFARNRSDPYG